MQDFRVFFRDLARIIDANVHRFEYDSLCLVRTPSSYIFIGQYIGLSIAVYQLWFHVLTVDPCSHIASRILCTTRVLV